MVGQRPYEDIVEEVLSLRNEVFSLQAKLKAAEDRFKSEQARSERCGQDLLVYREALRHRGVI